MPTKLLSAAVLAVASTTLFGTSALAGGACGIGVDCNTGVSVQPGYAPKFGPMTVQNNNPMGHLRSVNFQRAPHMSITRVHGMGPTAALSDAPSGFTGGCHPTSTQYCRQDMGTPVAVDFGPSALPPAPNPVPLALYSPPAPVYAAPVMSAPVVSAPRTVRIGGGYDPSKFTPRTYGDATLVPGIAYLPTSKVIRDPAAAQAMLDSGRTVPQSTTLGGQAPNMGMIAPSYQSYSVPTGPYGTVPMQGPSAQIPFQGNMNTGLQMQALGLMNTAGLGLAPTRFGPSRIQPSAPVAVGNGTYGSNVAPDGTYWEKVSGPTSFGSTVATQVICKRKLPSQVVNPVVGVPVPVPTAVPGCVVDVPHGGNHASHRYGGGQGVPVSRPRPARYGM